MKKHFIWKVFVLFLTLVLMMPTRVQAISEEDIETNLCEHHPVHTQDCGYVEGDESSCTFECSECNKDGSDEEIPDAPLEVEEKDNSIVQEETVETEETNVSNNKNMALNIFKKIGSNTITEAEIPQDVRDKLAQQGIYPAKKSEIENYWEVYDAPTKEEANIEAQIIISSEVVVPDNYLLYIKEVKADESFYPNSGTVQKLVGKYNDLNCYNIHWVKIDPSLPNGYTTDVESIIEGKQKTRITINYLNKNFGGKAGHRKLMVFSSKNAEGTDLEEASDTLKDASATTETYKSFTFETNHKGPYVFISKYVAAGYVQHLSMSITDGTAPFDETGTAKLNDNKLADNATVDVPGNDKDGHNKVVRSYDTIKYDINVNFASRASAITQEKAKVHFEMILYKSITAARFDLSQMLWMSDTSKIEYFDKNDNLVMVRQKNAKGEYVYYNVKNGQVDRSEEVNVNSLLDGSNNGKNSYTLHGESENKVAKQVLTGDTEIASTDPNNKNVLSSTQSFSAAIQVRNADNGEIFQPEFRLWFDDNEKNYGKEYNELTGEITPVQENNDNKIIADKVITSAGTNFNLSLKKKY